MVLPYCLFLAEIEILIQKKPEGQKGLCVPLFALNCSCPWVGVCAGQG